ncbi:twin-arginine translocation signal domain-containing protein [Caminibacter mediatlanticus TB-2]|nr:formate dehydrogenase, chain A [Caminibacter mediatlanticus TB-2]QCT95194.1 twin-arginine translocation signal domain-containing protein [Caminibacter mediatlanticus TB-2]
MSELKVQVGRRAFLKMAALSGVVGATSLMGSNSAVREATENELKEPFPGSKLVKTVCTTCSVGCGIIAEVQNGVWVRQEVAQDHPISHGSHCSKGIDSIDYIRTAKRVKHPLKKVNGKWKRISWDEAINEISEKMLKIRKESGPDATMFLGSAKMGTEQSYYFRKFAAFWGTNNIDHQARI